MNIVHLSLYQDFDCENSYEEAIDSHPYLSQLVDLIKVIPLTVNFNFDDAIERLLFLTRNIDDAMKTKGFLLIRDTPSEEVYVLNMFRMRGSRL